MSELTSGDVHIPSLVKVSLTYSLEEDRICLDGASASGEVFRMWLTARLLNRLVPYLVTKQLEFNAEFSAQTEFPVAGDASAQSEEERVICGPEQSGMLVTEVGLSVRKGHVVLTFQDIDRAKKASFAMHHSALDKWNKGLRHCYEQAGWPQDTFTLDSALRLDEQGAVTIH